MGFMLAYLTSIVVSYVIFRAMYIRLDTWDRQFHPWGFIAFMLFVPFVNVSMITILYLIYVGFPLKITFSIQKFLLIKDKQLRNGN